MDSRKFQIRLSCSYIDPDNTVDELMIETLLDDVWQPLVIDLNAPGFQIFIYGLFSCQHRYFRVNAAEKGLSLASSKAHMTIHTDEDWNIELLHVDFLGLLKQGEASQSDVDYITERMGYCPVSCNLKNITNNNRTVTIETVQGSNK